MLQFPLTYEGVVVVVFVFTVILIHLNKCRIALWHLRTNLFVVFSDRKSPSGSLDLPTVSSHHHQLRFDHVQAILWKKKQHWQIGQRNRYGVTIVFHLFPPLGSSLVIRVINWLARPLQNSAKSYTIFLCIIEVITIRQFKGSNLWYLFNWKVIKRQLHLHF